MRNILPITNDIVLVEDVFKYFEHSSYSNLLEFEQDLAELSALTVLFSESPGSIAVFGSFSVMKYIQDRMLVVMHQDDSKKESFIWRGPALFLKALAKEKGAQDPISIYYWRKRIKPQEHLRIDDFSDAEDLSESITSIISNRPKSEAWEKSKLGHIMLLILDMLKVLLLKTLEENTALLKNLGITLERKKVDRYLGRLFSIRYVIRKTYRHSLSYQTLLINLLLNLPSLERFFIRLFGYQGLARPAHSEAGFSTIRDRCICRTDVFNEHGFICPPYLLICPSI